MRTRVAMLACVIAVGLAVASPAHAQLWNKKTFFTFSEPVQLPGNVTLPAGKYVFQLAAPDSSRWVVRVQSEDGSKVYTTLFAIPTQRMKPADAPEIAFMETPANMPHAVKVWWYPGESTGREFIYPREQALRLARVINAPVLSTTASVSDEDSMRTAETTMITPDAAQVADNPPAVTAPEPEMSMQTPVATSGQDTPTPVASNSRSLPKTASDLPLVGLLGLFALAGAMTLRTFGRARS